MSDIFKLAGSLELNDLASGALKNVSATVQSTSKEVKEDLDNMSKESNKSFSSFISGIGKMGGSIGSGVATIGKWTLGIGAAATAIGTTLVGSLMAATTKVAATTDRIDKLSQRLGISREGFQEWEFVLSQSGSSMESLQSGMKVMVQRVADLEEGTGKGSEAFKELGIRFRDIKDLNQEETFALIVTKFNEMEDGAKKAALAQDIFSRSGQELLPLLNSNADAVENMKKQASDLGLILNDETIDAGVKFTDTMDQVKRSLGTLSTQFTSAIMPVIQDFLDLIIKNMPKIRDIAGKAFEAIGKATKAFISTFEDLIGLFKRNDGTITDFFKDIAIDVLTSIKNVVDGLNEWVKANNSVLNDIYKSINTVMSSVLDIIDTVWKSINRIWEDNSDDIKTFVSSTVKFISDKFLDFFKVMTKLWADNSEEIKDIAKDVMSFLEVVIGGTIGTIKTLWDWFGEGFINIFTAAWDTVATVVSTATNVVIDLIQALFKLLKGDVEGFQEELADAFIALWDGVAEVFSNIWGLFEPYLDDVWTFTKDWVTGLANDAITWFKDLWFDIANTANNLWVETKLKLTAFNTNINTWVINLGTDIVKNFQNIWIGIKTSVDNAWTFLQGSFETVKTNIVNFFGTIPEKAIELGKNIIDGIGQGIIDAKDAVVDKVGEVSDAVFGGVKDFFGIQSPSKLMAEMGMWMMLGMAGGLEANAQTPVDAMIANNVAIEDSVRESFGIHSESTLFKEFGGWMMQGMSSGIDEGGSVVLTSISNGLGNVIKELKTGEEPAGKAGTDIGNAIGKGISDGVTKGEQDATNASKTGKTTRTALKQSEINEYNVLYNEYYANLTNTMNETNAANVASLGGFSDLIGAVGQQIGGTFGDVTSAITAGADIASKAMTGDFIGAATSIVQNWDVFESAVSGIMDSIFGKSKSVSEKIQENWNNMLEIIEVDFEESLAVLGKSFADLAKDININTLAIQNDFSDMTYGNQGEFARMQAVIFEIIADIKEEFRAVSAHMSKQIELAVEFAENKFELLSDVAEAVFEGIQDTIAVAYQNSEYMTEETWNAITETVEAAVEVMTELVEEMTDIAIDEADRLGEAIIDALEARYEEERDMELDRIDESIKAQQELSDAKISILDEELLRKLAKNDKELQAELDRLDAEKDAIDAAREAEKLAAEDEAYFKDKQAAEDVLRAATTAEEKAKAQEEIDKIEADRQKELLEREREAREAQIDQEIQDAKDAAKIKQELLEAEHEADVEAAEKLNEEKIAALEEEKENTEAHYDALLDSAALQAGALLLLQQDNQEAILQLLADYAPLWQDAGQSVGEQLVNGVASQQTAMDVAVANIMNTVFDAAAAIDNLESLEEQANQLSANAVVAAQNAAAEAAAAAAEIAASQQVVVGVGQGGQPIYGNPTDTTSTPVDQSGQPIGRTTVIEKVEIKSDVPVDLQEASRRLKELEQDIAAGVF